ncbi:MAG: DUF6775 family putative metallopeptidase [Candidatus Hadarchaeum sp.]|uniref:DUF6775 family putative metallopeptidase n=1 Tax=Candidatus Hadarchaeum sp. TaxID=2883567 RepID=UPI003D0B6E66
MSPMRSSGKPSKPLPRIHLYEDRSCKRLDLKEIARYLAEKLGRVSVDIRAPLFYIHDEPRAKELAREFAGARIRDPTRKDRDFEPLTAEINLELKLLRQPEQRILGLLYDGVALRGLALKLIPEAERTQEDLHLVFTNRLFGTWDESDARYHARVSLYSFPCLISTTGIVEAPAKPKEFYALKQHYLALGAAAAYEELKEQFRDRFIDYDDERLTEVMKGYVMQALFYHLISNPFCEVKTCRLYNAHWQEEVILAQLGPKESEFCNFHSKLGASLFGKELNAAKPT